MESFWNKLLNALQSEFDIGRLEGLLVYQPDSPMLFSTGLFFFLFIGFLLIFMSLRKFTLARIIYVSLFSLYFYYKTSGLWFVLLIFTATSDFLIGRILSLIESKQKRKWLVVLSICINLGLLGYFKYTNFLYNTGVMALQKVGVGLDIPSLAQLSYTPLDIFLPVGISFFTFQSLSYIIDLYRSKIQPLTRWVDYLFFVSFFTGLVAGPIVRARDFVPQMYKKPSLSREQLGEALYLIICGLLKKCVISDYLSVNFVDRIFDAPALYSGFENLLGVYGYALQIYCDFSGYSDMAIGIALLLGIRFNINFDSPYQSATITEFWRRWHISLSSWLKDYLYISMGGNRKGKVRTYVHLLITMLLGGLWHGAALRFILWGGLHGVALAVHKFAMNRFGRYFKTEGSEMSPLRRIWSILFTFHVVCFGWIFFRADSVQDGFKILNQIVTDFRPDFILQFITGYTGVFLLLVIGYILHFIPRQVDNRIKHIVIHSPMPLQALYLIIAVFIVVQVKSAGIVPFIYFQF
ncbi:MAG: MBOAT family protein [Tannerella sp.]|jgi:D-alanyl-lipoteichoic acid acyltransferase DltB (MBOAT superfamily)|nr:MBOAT family protein [Tannerella sp.]